MTTSIDATVSGSITASAQNVSLDVTRKSSATITLSGTWVGTIQFEAATDAAFTNPVAVPSTPSGGGATVTSATANGTWTVNVSAYAVLRVRSSAWTSGTATVAIRASISPLGLTSGQVLFGGATGAAAGDGNLMWDSTNHRLALGKQTPNYRFDLFSAATTADDRAASVYQEVFNGVLNTHPYALEVQSDQRATDETVAQGQGHSAIRSVSLHGRLSTDSGGAVFATGSAGGIRSEVYVRNTAGTIAGASNIEEHSAWFGVLAAMNEAASVNPGGFWYSDDTLLGPIALQPSELSGRHMVSNNYYNGNPSLAAKPSGNTWLVTQPAAGAQAGVAPFNGQTTYPMQVGLGIVGWSGAQGAASAASTKGFVTGIQIGGAGSNWGVAYSHLGTGMSVADYETAGIAIGAPWNGSATTPGLTFTGSNGIGSTVPVATDNSYDLGATAKRFRTGYFGTSLSLANTGSINALDTIGGSISLLTLASDNTMRIGTLSAPTTNGHVIFQSKGIEAMRIDTSQAVKFANTFIGFFGAAAVAKQTVTGSRATTAVATSILAAMVAMGMVTDSTTA